MAREFQRPLLSALVERAITRRRRCGRPFRDTNDRRFDIAVMFTRSRRRGYNFALWLVGRTIYAGTTAALLPLREVKRRENRVE